MAYPSSVTMYITIFSQLWWHFYAIFLQQNNSKIEIALPVFVFKILLNKYCGFLFEFILLFTSQKLDFEKYFKFAVNLLISFSLCEINALTLSTCFRWEIVRSFYSKKNQVKLQFDRKSEANSISVIVVWSSVRPWCGCGISDLMSKNRSCLCLCRR